MSKRKKIKIITFLALVTTHRVQTFSKINIKNIQISSDNITIKIPDQIKTSRVGSLQPTLILPFYQIKPEICPGKTLLAYLQMTKTLRKNQKYLFVSLKKAAQCCNGTNFKSLDQKHTKRVWY